MPTCTVVVCTRNRPLQLDACLKALSAVDFPAMEVLVVDNAPSDSSARDIAQRHGVAYLEEPRPGLSRARNTGARKCKSDIVAYLDDDALPEPDWLKTLACEFEDAAVMAVTGRVAPCKIDTPEEQLYWRLDGHLPEEAGPFKFSIQTPGWFELANTGGMGIGANMAIRRSAFDLWTGFDERLGYGGILGGCEDYHAFCSLLTLGFQIVYTRRAVVKHPCRQEPMTMEFLRRKYINGITASSAYFTMLLLEEKKYRRQTLSYIWKWLIGKRQIKRQKIQPPLASFWQVLQARTTGALSYFRSGNPS